MGYYGIISAIKLEFLTSDGLELCLKELEEEDVNDPLRDNIEETYLANRARYFAEVVDNLQDWEIKLNGNEKYYLPIISKYARGYIEIRGDEVDDYRRFEMCGNGRYSIKYGTVVYDE